MPNDHSLPAQTTLFRHLLALRIRMTAKAFTRSPSAQTVGGIAVLLACPAAWQVGERAAKALILPPTQAITTLGTALLLLTLVYIALLLAGGTGVGGVIEPVPEKVLRTLPLRPTTVLCVDATGFLVSLPTILYLLAAVPILQTTGWHGALPLGSLGISCMASALLLDRLRGVLSRNESRARGWALIGLVLVGGLILHATPASAIASVLSEQRPAVRLPWDPPVPTMPPFSLPIPPFFAAHSLVDKSNTSAPLGLLLASSVGLVLIVLLLVRIRDSQEPFPANGSKASRIRYGTGRPLWTEWTLLVRDWSAHRSLRGPSVLLLAIGFAWIAPNLGNDAIRNLTDLVGMGLVLYLAVWQIQFLCNRFGGDAGQAATLFSLPARRSYLMLVKNLALLLLLFCVDSIILSGFAYVAGNPRLIPTLLGGLLFILPLLMALGNVVSVLEPFPLRRRTERYEREPDRSLIFVYVLVGIGAWILFLPVPWLRAQVPIAGVVASGVYVALVYAGSVALTTRLLTPSRERRIVALLDGVKL